VIQNPTEKVVIVTQFCVIVIVIGSSKRLPAN